MCTVSFAIDGWRHPTWPGPIEPYHPPTFPAPIPTLPAPGPNAIPWPTIQQDPMLAQKLLDAIKKLEEIDRRLGLLEKCSVTAKEKKNLKGRLRRIAKRLR